MTDCALQQETEWPSKADMFPYLGTNLLCGNINLSLAIKEICISIVHFRMRHIFKLTNIHKLQDIHLRHTVIRGLAEHLLFVNGVLTNCMSCQCL